MENAGLSEDERTPKRVKCMEPDLTVVVGGVEFYHYKFELAAGCPLIDTMLAAKMKESNESRIEFPDKDPKEWLNVYTFIDPTTNDNEKDKLFKSLLPPQDIAEKKVFDLLSWLDFLGMDSLVKRYDRLVAKHDFDYTIKTSKYSKYSSWEEAKHAPCPLVQKVRRERVKHAMILMVSSLSRKKKDWACNALDENIKSYLLDDQCGDEMWQYLLSKVDFPEDMLQEMDRDTIVNSPFFKHILEVCGRSLPHARTFSGKFSDYLEEENEEEGSDED